MLLGTFQGPPDSVNAFSLYGLKGSCARLLKKLRKFDTGFLRAKKLDKLIKIKIYNFHTSRSYFLSMSYIFPVFFNSLSYVFDLSYQFSVVHAAFCIVF